MDRAIPTGIRVARSPAVRNFSADRPATHDIVILGLILALALALRIPGLNGPLWFDEIATVVTHLRLPWAQMMTDYSMNHHYFHDVFAKIFWSLFGEVPWAIRMTALIFGIASIAAAWELARRVAGVPVAHATAVLLAVSYHHIWFSQNARGYTELAFFGTVGLILFLGGLRRPALSTWLWFGATLTASVFTHLTGAFLFVALGVVWLVSALREQSRELWINPLLGFLFGGIAAILLYVPVLPSLIASIGNVATTSNVDVMQEYQSPFWTVVEAMRTLFGSGNPLTPVVGGLVIALVLSGAIALRNKAPVFATAVLAHIAITIAILLAVGMRIWPRFFFVDIAFLMILIVSGVRLWCGIIADRVALRPGAVFAVATAAMVAVSLPLAARNYTAPKQDLAGAYALVESERAPGERIFAVGHAASAFTEFYGADWAVMMDAEEYRAEMAKPGPITFVVGFPGRVFRRIPDMAADIDGALTEEHWFRGTLGDGGVVVLKRD